MKVKFMKPIVNYRFSLLVILIFNIFSHACFAKVELFTFENQEQEQMYDKLSEQLRCLVCQNQNLADSNAELAQDMRNKTYQLILENKTEEDIIDYWVSRYGDFVLYNPPFKQVTLILWIGPFVLLLVAIFIGYRVIRANKNKENMNTTNKDKANNGSTNKDVEREEIKKLLDS